MTAYTRFCLQGAPADLSISSRRRWPHANLHISPSNAFVPLSYGANRSKEINKYKLYMQRCTAAHITPLINLLLIHLYTSIISAGLQMAWISGQPAGCHVTHKKKKEINCRCSETITGREEKPHSYQHFKKKPNTS